MYKVITLVWTRTMCLFGTVTCGRAAARVDQKSFFTLYTMQFVQNCNEIRMI